ncbi:KGK domain-containing protein [Kamptonema sp. UHCC 0994]|uniref:KGK domain-containing protein n=1 Tax=Kamptonema sp. UHCC 0994 TaxID=3031329 RepID=UPI0023B95F3B|nr:KGK domain-containing protein [Kamptonema sp. UHCC 0994]MDF0553189.1 KGK domain-containing protein [Kamptonema sp. UHCC 0994]
MPSDETTKILPDFQDDDVISFPQSECRVGRLRQAAGGTGLFGLEKHPTQQALISQQLRQRLNILPENANWLEGVQCEILKLDQAKWKKGRLKVNLSVSVTFLPDEE